MTVRHIPLIGRNLYDFPKRRMFLQKCKSSKISRKIGIFKKSQPTLHCCAKLILPLWWIFEKKINRYRLLSRSCNFVHWPFRCSLTTEYQATARVGWAVLVGDCQTDLGHCLGEGSNVGLGSNLRKLGRKKWWVEGWGPKGARPKISRFFPSPATKFVLFFPLWGSSRGILVVFEAPGASNVHVWNSRAVMWSPGGPEAAQANNQRAQTCTSKGPSTSKTPPKFHEKTPRDRERTKWGREMKKKRHFWLSGGGGPGGGRVRRRVVWRRVVQGSPNLQQPKQPQPQQHQHRQKWRVEAKSRRRVAPKGGGGRRVGPKRSGLLSGLWGLGFSGFRKFGKNTETLKLAKVAKSGSRSPLWCGAPWRRQAQSVKASSIYHFSLLSHSKGSDFSGRTSPGFMTPKMTASLWNMPHCGTSSLYNHLDNCFVVLRHIQQSFLVRRLDVWGNTVYIIQNIEHSSRWPCAWLASRFTTGLTVQSWVWIVFPTTQTIRSHKSRAGIPS